MSKITDLEEIRTQALVILAEQSWHVLDYFGIDEAANIMTMIYVTNDTTTGFGQDYAGNLSVISSPTRIAVIFGGGHSFYQMDEAMCQYEDLEEDLRAVLLCLDTAIARLEASLA